MCGILAAIDTENVNDWTINQLEDQISRGQDGLGGLFINNGKIITKRSTEICKMLIDLYANQSKFIILHHRTPTSSENKISQTHPLFVSNEMLEHDYYVIHNGMINNEDELRKEHEKEGFKYLTIRNTSTGVEEFNDSESLAIEVSKFIEGKSKAIKARGSAAFIVLKVDKTKGTPIELIFGRQNNPLNMSMTGKKLRLSSEGEGAPIKEKTLYTYNLKKNKIESKKPFCLAEYEYKGKTKAVGFHTKSSDSRKYDNDTEYTQYNDDYKDEYPEEYRESWGEKIYGENGQHRIAMDAIETTIDDLAFEVSNIGKIYRTPEEAIQEAMELVKIAMEDMVRGIENEALTSLEEDEEHINTKRELCESIQQREK